MGKVAGCLKLICLPSLAEAASERKPNIDPESRPPLHERAKPTGRRVSDKAIELMTLRLLKIYDNDDDKELEEDLRDGTEREEEASEDEEGEREPTASAADDDEDDEDEQGWTGFGEEANDADETGEPDPGPVSQSAEDEAPSDSETDLLNGPVRARSSTRRSSMGLGFGSNDDLADMFSDNDLPSESEAESWHGFTAEPLPHDQRTSPKSDDDEADTGFATQVPYSGRPAAQSPLQPGRSRSSSAARNNSSSSSQARSAGHAAGSRSSAFHSMAAAARKAFNGVPYAPRRPQTAAGLSQATQFAKAPGRPGLNRAMANSQLPPSAFAHRSKHQEAPDHAPSNPFVVSPAAASALPSANSRTATARPASASIPPEPAAALTALEKRYPHILVHRGAVISWEWRSNSCWMDAVLECFCRCFNDDRPHWEELARSLPQNTLFRQCFQLFLDREVAVTRARSSAQGVRGLQKRLSELKHKFLLAFWADPRHQGTSMKMGSMRDATVGMTEV